MQVRVKLNDECMNWNFVDWIDTLVMMLLLWLDAVWDESYKTNKRSFFYDALAVRIAVNYRRDSTFLCDIAYNIRYYSIFIQFQMEMNHQKW